MRASFSFFEQSRARREGIATKGTKQKPVDTNNLHFTECLVNFKGISEVHKRDASFLISMVIEHTDLPYKVESSPVPPT